jgi:hypothetical protein
LVEADEDTDIEVGGEAETGLDAGGAAKSRRKTRSAVAKQSSSSAAAAVSAVKAVEKKKRRRKAPSPLVVMTLTIPTPHSREVESEEEEEDEATEESPVEGDRPARRSESPAAKRQRELVEKTSEDALYRGLEAQRTAVEAQEKMPMSMRPRFFGSKPSVAAITR